MEFKNEVNLKGEIVSKYNAKGGHVVLTVRTYKFNLPTVFFPNGTPAKEADKYDIGDTVYIKGNLQSRKFPGHFSCSIFGDEISSVEDDNRKNHFEVSGRLIRMTTSDNMCSFLVETNTGYYSTVPVVMYRSKHIEKLLKHEIGDFLTLYGVIQTKKIVDVNGERHYYENYVAYSCA